MLELLLEMEKDKDVVIVKGSGKVFSAGGDVKELSTDPSKGISMYKCAGRSFDLISNYKKPYVGFIDGTAMGGAAIYSMSGKYRIVTERTSFSMPENTIGYFNDGGSSYFLSRLDHNLGLYIGLTGAPINGTDMKKYGLATHFIMSYKLDEVEQSLIKCKTHDDVERILNENSSSYPLSIASELDLVLPNIKKCFSALTVEEIYENLHLDGSDWAKKTLAALDRKSPTSLKVSHRSITSGRNISLRDCLKMEMRLTVHHMENSDLKEGVRALLIDKDFKPKWNRKTVYDVTRDDVDRFFGPISDAHELTFIETIKCRL